jgi:ABC-2 type transport system ATP-binding protein
MAIIEIENLQKRYGERYAVRDISLSVEAGEIVGIIGPNGAGKTTTVECVVGLRRPDGGTIRVLDLPVSDPRLRALVGVQLQAAQLPDRMRAGEALALYASFYPDPADPRVLLDELGLTEHADRPFAKLSGGQRQRLSIGLALVGNPRVVILDELTTGLDPAARRDVWRMVGRIRDRGVTVLLVTHFMDEIERLCDRAVVIARGRVVAAGTPAELVARVETAANLEDAFVALTDVALTDVALTDVVPTHFVPTQGD